MTGKLKQFFLSTPGLWVIFILWTLFVSNLWLPRNWGFYGTDDWDLTYSTFEVARKSIVEYGQWPSFNPYLAFGSDLDANPQATHASIFFIPVWLFGSFYGYKLSILIAIIIGCWGAFKLFSRIHEDKFIVLCISLAFAGCSYFARHIFQAGHSNVLYFYFLPWLAYFLQRLITRYRPLDLVWPVLILSQTICGGAPFVFIVFALMMFLWGIGLWWIEKKGPKPAGIFLAIIILSIGLSFWKVWPVIQFWGHMPRLVNDESGINLLVWLQALADIETDTRTAHQWHEFAMGYSLVLLGLTIFYFRNIPNASKWLWLSVIVFWLSLGNMPDRFNPWFVLNHYVPFFTSLRSPYRFGILIVFILCISFLLSIKYESNKRLIYIVLVTCILTQALIYNAASKKLVSSPRIEDFSFTNKELKPIAATNSIHKYQFVLIKQNYLVTDAYEPLYLDPVTDTMSNFIVGGHLEFFSPNKTRINPDSSSVTICLRYSEHWQLIGSGSLVSFKGLLQIKNAKGPLTLVYRNRHLKSGVIISLLSLLLLFVLAIYSRRYRQSAF